jgi:hypothetical protein
MGGAERRPAKIQTSSVNRPCRFLRTTNLHLHPLLPRPCRLWAAMQWRGAEGSRETPSAPERPVAAGEQAAARITPRKLHQLDVRPRARRRRRAPRPKALKVFRSRRSVRRQAGARGQSTGLSGCPRCCRRAAAAEHMQAEVRRAHQETRHKPGRRVPECAVLATRRRADPGERIDLDERQVATLVGCGLRR